MWGRRKQSNQDSRKPKPDFHVIHMWRLVDHRIGPSTGGRAVDLYICHRPGCDATKEVPR